MGEGEQAKPARGTSLILPFASAFAGGVLALLVVNGVGALHQHSAADAPASQPAPASPAHDGAFVPPDPSTIPAGPEGDAIRRGMAVFADTPGNAREYVGNALSCTNCHLDGGRRAKASPMWAAWGMYPQYRKKNGRINDMEDRIRGCFQYSMNAQNSPAGKAPEPGDAIYRDLEVYFHWLATGAPTGVKLAGAGYPKLDPAKAGYDPLRGAVVFARQCASCHGADGQGSHSGRTVTFPPLWGAHSYNWGAGMARVDNAAAFIKWNMPYGAGGTLSDQDAWDVAAYVDSHERPKDPRQTGTVADAAAKLHADEPTYYGKSVNGVTLGAGVPGSPL